MAALKEGRKVVATVNLTEFDVELILAGLGNLENLALDQRRSNKAVRNVINKIYRAMGVKL